MTVLMSTSSLPGIIEALFSIVVDTLVDLLNFRTSAGCAKIRRREEAEFRTPAVQMISAVQPYLRGATLPSSLSSTFDS